MEFAVGHLYQTTWREGYHVSSQLHLKIILISIKIILKQKIRKESTFLSSFIFKTDKTGKND